MLFQKLKRRLLQLQFGFDKWHISPLGERPYAVDVINYCNVLEERISFAEIGCGLGDITRNVNFLDRTGYDMDPKVLKAAAILPVKGTIRKIEFAEFHFPESILTGTYNVLALINWIHHIEPAVLKEKIEFYFRENLLDMGELIIDTVQDSAYKHNHRIGYLTKDINCSVQKIGDYARQREVWSIKKNH